MSHFPNCATLKNQPAPEVGMGATLVMYSDRRAYTISRVSKSGKTFWMRQDKATRVDNNGMSESQQYAYTQQSDAPETQVHNTKDGWKSGGHKVWVGLRDEHYDFSF